MTLDFQKGLILLIWFGAINFSTAQVELSDRFTLLLESANLEFLEPVEASYKSTSPDHVDFYRFDFLMRSRKEKMDIGFLITPYSASNRIFSFPQVEITRLVSSLATNDETSVITSLNLDQETLSSQLNADWGKLFFFKPKPSFSDKLHCKLLSIYKENMGLAVVVYCFDEPGKALDIRENILRFLK